MKDFGKITKQMEKGSFGTLMEMSMKVIGRMTRLTVLEFIYTLMEQSMKENGRMIYSMDSVLNPGQMEVNTRENTKRE